ncbi:MAG: 2Fe-2S iron-sulfur cluster binding domain-containing protein, partial [Anaerolineaceae bacterium]
MAEYKVTIIGVDKPVVVPSGSLLVEAAKLAKIDILQPCGGQGRCGRCIVQVKSGNVRRRSELHLTPEDLEEGFVLACQTVVEGDVVLAIPPQEK